LLHPIGDLFELYDDAQTYKKKKNQELTSTSCTKMFISVFIRAPLRILSQINLHNALPNYLFKIHFNSILALVLQLSIRSAGFPTNTEHISLLPHKCNSPAYLNTLRFITQ